MKKIRKKKWVAARKAPVVADGSSLLERVQSSVKENYRYASVLAVVIVFVIVFVPVYRHYSRKRDAEALRAVEQALASETIEEKLALLQGVLDGYGGTLPASHALYYLGDAYYGDGQYDLARESYEQYLQRYPRGQFAPNAQEGIGYVAESEGKFGEAIGHYMKLAETYGDSYVAQHAWYSIGRCHEQGGEWAAAVDAYEKQLSLHPMSVWTGKAETRLGEIRFKLFSAQAGDDAGAVTAPADSAEAAAAEVGGDE